MLPVSGYPPPAYSSGASARRFDAKPRVQHAPAFSGSAQTFSVNVQTSKAFYPAKPMPWAIRTFHKLFSGLICWPLGFKTEINNLDRLKALKSQPNGMVMAMNHSSLADSATLQQISNHAGLTPVTMASLSMFDQQLFHLPMRVVWPIASRLGLFSMNEANPTMARSKAFAHKVLEQRKYPLAIFPEGRVNWNSTRMAPCRTGSMAFAQKAANSNHQAVNVVPIGITYTYAPQAAKQAKNTLLKLERQIRAQIKQGKPLPELNDLPEDATLPQRIGRLTNWVLAKEEKELNQPVFSENQAGRIEAIRNKKLSDLRVKYDVPQLVRMEREIPKLYKAINERQRENQKPSFWVMLNPWASKRKAYRDTFKQLQADMRQLKTLEILQSCQDAIGLESDLTRQMEALHRLQCLITGKRPGTFTVMRNCTAYINVGQPIAVTPLQNASEEVVDSHVKTLTGQLQTKLQDSLEQAKAAAQRKSDEAAS